MGSNLAGVGRSDLWSLPANQSDLGFWRTRRDRGRRDAHGGGRTCRRSGFVVHSQFNQALGEFREQIKALARSSDPEVRKNLPVPYEYRLHHECERRDKLPFEGGWLEQPHILLLCFRLIDDELAQVEVERRKLEEINRQAQKVWLENRKNG